MTDREKKAADEWSLARIVGVVAQHIPGDKNEKFLVLIRRFTDEGARVRALTAISQAFSDPQSEEIREEAFNLAQSIENPWLRCRALTGLAYRLPQYKVQALQEAITAVEGIPSEYHRARALGGMAGLLPEELVDKALELIRSIQDDALRFYYLAFFAPHLTEEEQMRVLKAITSSPGDVMHIQALLALSKVLPSPAMKEVLTYVHGLTQPEAKAYALASLASKYPEEEALMEDALSAALQIINPYDRTELLGQLASQLPESDRSEVINTEISAVRQSEQRLCLKSFSQLGPLKMLVCGQKSWSRCIKNSPMPIRPNLYRR